MRLKAWILRFARTEAGGFLVWLGVRAFWWMLPVRIRKREPAALRMEHPVPMAPGHEVVVPRQRIRSLEDGLQEPGAWEKLAAFLLSHTKADAEILICNLGERQEVGQLHVHVLPAARYPNLIATGIWDEKARCVLPRASLGNPEGILRLIRQGRQAGFPGMSFYWI